MSLTPKNKSKLLKIKSSLNNWLKIDIVRFPTQEFEKKIKLIETNSIDLVMDVGANIGQFAIALRKSGYKGDIYSFEPMKNEYAILEKNTSADAHWRSFNYGLGNENAITEIYVAENSVSSSFLPSSEEMNEIEPGVIAATTQEVEVKTLDTVYEELDLVNRKVFLKIDAQGYEKFILEGGKNTIPKIKLVQLEMPLISTYENSSDFYTLTKEMQNIGFQLVSLDSGYYNPKTGEQVEVDGIFINRN